MRAAWIIACVVAASSCGERTTIRPGAPEALPHPQIATTSHGGVPGRMLPPEAYLRAYLMWFGGRSPRDVEILARPGGMFDTWDVYLAALGLPDYKRDLPRQEQSNTLMLAALGRLGETLCIRAAEQDLHRKTPLASRMVFRFELATPSDLATFAADVDVLHRKFLGYPLRLAPASRGSRLFELYRAAVARHAGAVAPLTAEEAGWAVVCTALVQHPEAEIY
jgi:hypothetical protein